MVIEYEMGTGQQEDGPGQKVDTLKRSEEPLSEL